MRGDLDAQSPTPSSTNGQHVTKGQSGSPKTLRSTATNGAAAGNDANGNAAAARLQDQSSFFGHDREEVTRILIQSLQDLGYHKAAGALSDESGYNLETNSAAAFRFAVLEGNWAEAEALLPDNLPLSFDDGNDQSATNGHSSRKSITSKLALAVDANVEEMLFLLRQQKYLELLETEDRPAALAVLRHELQPLNQDERRLHALSSLIMCPSAEDLKAQAGWDGARGESRKHLLSVLSRAISPAAMIPEHRLAELLMQVKDAQVKSCEYHNNPQWPSLYMDHLCESDDFPSVSMTELSKHSDEVWVLQFSHDGTRLATAGKDNQAIIWSMDTFQPLHVLGGSNSTNAHRESVAYVAWSPDDTKLVTCSQDREARVWDTSNRRCLHVIKHHSEPVTTAAFAPDGKTFVTGAFDLQHPLAIWNATNLSDTPVYSFTQAGFRVRDCAIAAVKPPSSSIAAYTSNPMINGQDASSAQPVRLVIVTTDNSIQVFDYHRRERLSRISMEAEITCLSLSSDGNDMLFNLSFNEVWALGIEDGIVRQKYRGQKQGEFVVRSCFGGATEGFVVSGGEDSHIQIWHRYSGRLLEQFPSHRGSECCINAVAWNPVRPEMWASAGDDAKVRIYGPPPRNLNIHITSPLLESQPARGILPQWGSTGDGLENVRSVPRRIFGAPGASDDPDFDPDR